MREYRAVWYRKRWYAEWYSDDGKRCRQSLRTAVRSEVADALAKVQADREARERPRVITVAYAWDGYRQSLGEKPAAVTMGHEWKALRPHFGDRSADALTELDCDRYIAARRALGRSDGTIWTEMGHLRSALRWAERKNLIAKAPSIKRPERPPPRDKRMTREQIRTFIDSCDKPHVKLFVRLAVATAARMGALLDLTWDRVDLGERRILLHNPERQRTNKGRSTVPINDTLFKALTEAHRGATSRWVIEWGGERVKSVKKGLTGAGRRSGMPWVTAHVFRHSAACLMAQDGVPMAEISQFLGHADSRLTERVYARFSPTYLRKAAKSLDF